MVAAGDIACAPGDEPSEDECRQADTARLVDRLDPRAVLVLGDVQYPDGELDDFRGSFAESWGRFRELIRPAPGNHEYHTDGEGYYAYFGDAAGPAGRGWYSFDVGGWHVVSLNSNCGDAGGCDEGSAQGRWLAADLRANEARCTLAYWHHARFSSGFHGDDDTVAPLWRLLDRAGADVVLVGHDHHYERFAPQDADGAADPEGIREFVVGTGGKSFYGAPFAGGNSERRVVGYFGVLELQLGRRAYAWRFVDVDGRVHDRGAARCR